MEKELKKCRGCKEELELYMFKYENDNTSYLKKRCIICDGSLKRYKKSIRIGNVSEEVKEWVDSVERRAGYVELWEVYLLFHYVEEYLFFKNNLFNLDIEINLMWNKLREASKMDFKMSVNNRSKNKTFNMKEYQRQYREENKEYFKEKNREYYYKNKEIKNKDLSNLTEEELKEYKREYHREWREKNRELVNGYWRDYYERNKEEVQERQKKWREENKDKIKETGKKYLKKLKTENPDYYKEYYEKNKERILEQARERYRKKRDLEN